MSHEKQKYDFIPQLDNPANVHHIELSMVPENSLVLDIGCHTGIFAEALKLRKNAIVVGIDTDNNALEIALPKMQAVINMNIELSGWDDELRSRGYNNFDAIIFGDVLEHTRNPELILKATRTLLKQDGRIIVSIPNVAQWRVRFGLLFGNFQYADFGILDRTHLRFFTSESAKKMLEECGYRIVREDFSGFRLPHWLIRRFHGLLAFQLVYAASPMTTIE